MEVSITYVFKAVNTNVIEDAKIFQPDLIGRAGPASGHKKARECGRWEGVGGSIRVAGLLKLADVWHRHRVKALVF
jgi:hypothetical protein